MNHQCETRQSVCPHDAMKLSEAAHGIAICVCERESQGVCVCVREERANWENIEIIKI